MNPTILFADDERGIRQYCKEELEIEGFRVILAQDGEDAVDVLNDTKVDLVVLDQHMPRCSGLEAARQVKRLYPDLPVILFTLDTHYERYRSPVVEASIIKSENLDTLKAIIRRLLSTTRCSECPSFDPAPAGPVGAKVASVPL